MSNPTHNPTVTVVGGSTEEPKEVVEKQNFVTKTKTFVKNHKRPAIAVGALVGLVGVAALAGRKEPLPAFEANLELEPPHATFDAEVKDPENDTETA